MFVRLLCFAVRLTPSDGLALTKHDDLHNHPFAVDFVSSERDPLPMSVVFGRNFGMGSTLMLGLVPKEILKTFIVIAF